MGIIMYLRRILNLIAQCFSSRKKNLLNSVEKFKIPAFQTKVLNSSWHTKLSEIEKSEIQVFILTIVTSIWEETWMISLNYPLLISRNVGMGTSTASARVSAFASAYAPLLVSFCPTQE